MQTNTNSDIQFLAGGGEMGRLIREKDWSQNPFGTPENWPQNLRTTLSILLNSKFPMFLFWGPELICFYNDTYRASLGNEGKHPDILGGRAEDYWKEIWKDIKPIIDQVLQKGEGSWNEDMLLPIYRNGKLEDVYWTFSYSPVNDEFGKPEGVFVTCNETTDKILSQKEVLEGDAFNKTVLENSSDCVKLIDIDGRIQYMNTNGLCLMEIDDFNLINNKFWSELWGIENQNLINETIEKVKEGQTVNFQAFCPTDKGNPKWWDVSVSPIKELGTNKIIQFISVSRDITSNKIAEKALRESEERLRLATETSEVGIWEWNILSNQVRWDNQMFRIYGITPTPDGTIEYAVWRNTVAVEDIEVQEKLLQNIIKNKSKSRNSRSFKIIRKNDGKLCYIEAVETLRFNTEGEAQWVVGTNIDVTEQVIVAEQLKKTSSHLELSTTSAEVGTWLLQIDSEKLEWSSLHKRMWGYDENLQNLDFENWHSIIHPEDKKKCFIEVENSRKEKRKYEVDYRILRANDGIIRWMKSVGQYQFNEKGEAITLTGISIDITDAKIAEEKLLASEEKLQLIIDASELGTWELNLKTREAIYSDRYLQIIGGYTKHLDLTHDQLLAHLHPDDLGIRNKAVKDALATGYLHYEARTIWNDKSVHWMEGKGKVFYDAHGEAEKMIGTIRDITKERTQQLQLIENERKFRLLADSMPQHIWTADTEGNLNYFNKSVFEYSGLSLKQIYEKGWLDIVHPDDRDENVQKWIHSITTGEDFLLEHRFRRHDGNYRWQLSRAIPQRDEEGNIQMWVGTSTDIQDQKEFANELEKQVTERTKQLVLLNQSLKQSEERYHLMVGEVQDYAILYLSKDGIVENWNKGAEKIKGYAADEIIGKSFSAFYTEEDRKSNLPTYLLQQAAKYGRYGQEGWRVKKDGNLFWASVVITAIHNETGTIIGYSKVTHDLTYKKEADDKIKRNAAILEQKNEELEKMNKELQSFAYISSHDLQEPLRKIQTFSDQIVERESHNLSESGKDKFQRMQNAAKRMQTLINDLLAYSRSNTQEKKLTKTNLVEIIENIQEDLNEELQQKNGIIEFDKKKCEVEIIPFQFHQLLFNLVSNSLKFSKENESPVIKIKYEIKKGSDLHCEKLIPELDYCHITFSDNGIGFDQQYSEKIFEVFQRLHGKELYQGTGIGLAIVKKIMDNHNGVIAAKGELGKGATFTIIFPIKGLAIS
ncbi:PAS domain S-box protein [Flavobacterium sp. 25HG05S-40]|uniref:PAS domain S-box protein n=1 Tax=Flavobacterium sp. 25HG05S-40 TaxID=3458682 RepID=UPI0040448605